MNAFALALKKKGLVTDDQIKAAEPKPPEPEVKEPEPAPRPKTTDEVWSEQLFSEFMGGFESWKTPLDVPLTLMPLTFQHAQHAFRLLMADPYRDKQTKIYYDFILFHTKSETLPVLDNAWKLLRYCPHTKIETTVNKVLREYVKASPNFTTGEMLFIQSLIMAPLILNLYPSQTYFDEKKRSGADTISLKFKFTQGRHAKYLEMWPWVGCCVMWFSEQAVTNTVKALQKDAEKWLKENDQMPGKINEENSK